MSRAPSVEDTANPSRRVALRALLILVAITVVLAAATAIYLFTRPTPYSGNWVGPGNFQGSGDPYAIEMYLSLEQKPFGGISGTGTLCVATGGTIAHIPLMVSGNLAGSSADLTLHASAGDAPISPATLAVQGMLDQGQLTLSAESPAHLLLTMQHGSMRDFTVACGQFSASTAKG
jgi:hypothetical protein